MSLGPAWAFSKSGGPEAVSESTRRAGGRRPKAQGPSSICSLQCDVRTQPSPCLGPAQHGQANGEEISHLALMLPPTKDPGRGPARLRPGRPTTPRPLTAPDPGHPGVASLLRDQVAGGMRCRGPPGAAQGQRSPWLEADRMDGGGPAELWGGWAKGWERPQLLGRLGRAGRPLAALLGQPPTGRGGRK